MEEESSSDVGCAVCGDRVNGTRYGVPACLGCIVFFRRAIVRNAVYTCQRNGRCMIDMKSRCTCRYCRLQKCLEVGMQPESIQRRDMMGPRKKVPEEDPRPPSLPLVTASVSACPDNMLPSLLRLQEKQKEGHRSWFVAGGPSAPDIHFVDHIHSDYHTQTMRRARKQDVNTMFHLAIVDACEWGCRFSVFNTLPPQLKKEVLREYAVAFMLIDQGFNTSRQFDSNLWILQHDRVYMCTDYMHGLSEEERRLPHAEAKAKLHPDFVQECLSVLGVPMRELAIDSFECAVLKTLLLFQCNVYPSHFRDEISRLREKILHSLSSYEAAEHPQDGIERIGGLLLMISNLRCCIIATYRQVAISDVFSLMSFDPLVTDVLLNK